MVVGGSDPVWGQTLGPELSVADQSLEVTHCCGAKCHLVDDLAYVAPQFQLVQAVYVDGHDDGVARGQLLAAAAEPATFFWEHDGAIRFHHVYSTLIGLAGGAAATVQVLIHGQSLGVQVAGGELDFAEYADGLGDDGYCQGVAILEADCLVIVASHC